MLRRCLCGVLAVVAVVLAVAAAVASPASAHAMLESTSPVEGARLAGPVRLVTATFDETVGISPDSLRVYGPDGSRVDSGGALPGRNSRQVEVRLRSHLPEGTFTVSWQVVSADSHPVAGAFTFSIGHASAHVAASAVASGSSAAFRVVYGVFRFAGFLGFAVLVGGMVFLALCWPVGGRDPRARALLWSAWATCLVGAVFVLLMQGAYANSGGFSDLGNRPVLVDTLNSRFGFALTTRMILLAVAGVAVSVALLDVPGLRRRSRWVFAGCCLALGVGLAGTWAFVDHASVGRQRDLATAADMLHLTAMACWVGGLAVLVLVALRTRYAGTAGHAVDVFSPYAGWCVALIIATGSYQTWRNMGSWAALAETTYGRLVLLKIAGLAVLVVLGYQARRIIGHTPVRSRSRSGRSVDAQGLRTLRLSVTVEVVVVLAVLGVTAALVNTPTGQEAYHPVAQAARAFDTGTKAGTVDVVVAPATLGPQVARVTVRDRQGHRYDPAQVTAALALPARHLGPLALQVRKVGPGRYRTVPQTVGVTGDWTLSLTVRSDAFDETTVDVPVTIR